MIVKQGRTMYTASTKILGQKLTDLSVSGLVFCSVLRTPIHESARFTEMNNHAEDNPLAFSLIFFFYKIRLSRKVRKSEKMCFVLDCHVAFPSVQGEITERAVRLPVCVALP